MRKDSRTKAGPRYAVALVLLLSVLALLVSPGTAAAQYGPQPPGPITCVGPADPDAPAPPGFFKLNGLVCYFDPSGIVCNTSDDTAVTLFRSDSAGGPFTQVPDGSTILSPSNRANPDVASSDGRFGWDVVPGVYRVQVRDNATGQVLESASLQIPPPVTNLRFDFNCPGGGTRSVAVAGRGPLSFTGFPTDGPIRLASALIVAGALLTLVVRKRRRHDPVVDQNQA